MKKHAGVEVIFETLVGIGAFTTVKRFEKAVRPKSRFIVGELGVKCFEACAFAIGTGMGAIVYNATKEWVKSFIDDEASDISEDHGDRDDSGEREEKSDPVKDQNDDFDAKWKKYTETVKKWNWNEGDDDGK